MIVFEFVVENIVRSIIVDVDCSSSNNHTAKMVVYVTLSTIDTHTLAPTYTITHASYKAPMIQVV